LHFNRDALNQEVKNANRNSE